MADELLSVKEHEQDVKRLTEDAFYVGRARGLFFGFCAGFLFAWALVAVTIL